METSSRAFTNGPEGNLLLTLSDDNSSLQLRPKSAKNRIIPIITIIPIIPIITILANRQGALAALGKPTYLITSRMSLFLHPFLQSTKKKETEDDKHCQIWKALGNATKRAEQLGRFHPGFSSNFA